VENHHKRNKKALVRCREVADRQYGVLSRTQALDCGLSRRALERLVRDGDWVRVAPGVYRIAGATHRYQRYMILSLWLGDRGVLSHTSAAVLWRLRGIREHEIEVTVTTSRRLSGRKTVMHQVQILDEADITCIEGIRTTTACRTICDLAGTVPHKELEIAVDDGLRRGLFSLARLRWQLKRSGRGRKGLSLLAKIIDGRDPSFRPTTPLETRIGRILLLSEFVPPVTQFEVVDGGDFVARFDFAWPECKVGIECESYEWHSGRAAWRRDTTRFNDLLPLGWRAFRATDEDARDPAALLRTLSGLVPKRKQGELFQKKHQLRAFSDEGESDD
jgi:hypothetical protein